MKYLLCLLLCLPALAVAQPVAAVADPAQPAASAQQAPLRTLETIEALRPDVDWRSDPFARPDNRFAERWKYKPSAEDIALKHGGYINYGITQALASGGRWLNRVTGGPQQIQHAAARDVPLDDEQIARAARWAAQQQGSTQGN